MISIKKIAACILIVMLYQLPAYTQNVGIGTTSPNASAQLDVSSTSKGMLVPRMTFVQRNAIATPAAGLLIYQTDFVAGFYFYNGAAWTQLSTGSAVNYFTASGSNIYSNNTGNVGIGVTAPADKLHTKGTAIIESLTATGGATLKMYGGTSGLSSIYFYEDVAAPSLRSFLGVAPGTGGYAQWGYNARAVNLNDEGLGIDNAAPLTKLHILGGQDAGLLNTNNGYLMLGAGNGANIAIDNNEIVARNNSVGADLFMQHDGGNIILCGNEQGAVGIGVTAGNSIPAGYLLAVDGKVISEEVKVQLSGNWPDYVFDKKYKLLSLDELKEYISINKHLPNIPAAKEVEKNGIELGDMQKRMLEKIEELTLYVLELEQKVKLLEQKRSK